MAETRWQEPLEVDGDRLLLDERGLVAVVETEAAGLVAVAGPAGRGDLDVVSVIADPELPSELAWAASDEVTGWILDGTLLGRRVPAAGLEPGHAWTVARVRRELPLGSDRTEVWDASLSAWYRETSTELTEAPGVKAVSSTVLTMIDLEPKWGTCVQGAMAPTRRAVSPPRRSR